MKKNTNKVSPHFGIKLKELRKREGYSQSILAKKLGTTNISVSNYEKSKNVPRNGMIEKMSKLFKYPLDELLHLASGKTPFNDAVSNPTKPEDNISENGLRERILSLIQEGILRGVISSSEIIEAVVKAATKRHQEIHLLDSEAHDASTNIGGKGYSRMEESYAKRRA